VDLEQQAPARTQRPRERREHSVVCLRIEVAERREPVDDRVELALVGQRAHVTVVKARLRVPLARELNPALGVVDPDNLAAPPGEPPRDPPFPAGNVEHPHPGLERQQPRHQIRFAVAALRAEQVGVEVEVVVVEQLGRDGH
jgi:hypothetical protein